MYSLQIKYNLQYYLNFFSTTLFIMPLSPDSPDSLQLVSDLKSFKQFWKIFILSFCGRGKYFYVLSKLS